MGIGACISAPSGAQSPGAQIGTAGWPQRAPGSPSALISRDAPRTAHAVVFVTGTSTMLQAMLWRNVDSMLAAVLATGRGVRAKLRLTREVGAT